MKFWINEHFLVNVVKRGLAYNFSTTEKPGMVPVTLVDGHNETLPSPLPISDNNSVAHKHSPELKTFDDHGASAYTIPAFRWKIRNKTSGHELITKFAYPSFYPGIEEDWGSGKFKYLNYEAIGPVNG